MEENENLVLPLKRQLYKSPRSEQFPRKQKIRKQKEVIQLFEPLKPTRNPAREIIEQRPVIVEIYDVGEAEQENGRRTVNSVVILMSCFCKTTGPINYKKNHKVYSCKITEFISFHTPTTCEILKLIN